MMGIIKAVAASGIDDTDTHAHSVSRIVEFESIDVVDHHDHLS